LRRFEEIDKPVGARENIYNCTMFIPEKGQAVGGDKPTAFRF